MRYHRPYPSRISQWDNMDEIIYECPNCGTSFGFYSNRELFCHHCGAEINWKDVPIHCPENIKNMYHNADTVEGREKAMEELLSWLEKQVLFSGNRSHRKYPRQSGSVGW